MSTEKDDLEEKVPLRYLVKDVANNVDKINYNVEQMTKGVNILNQNMARANTTLYGDEGAKIDGVVHKIEKVEGRMEKFESDKKAQNKLMAIISGVSAGVGVAIAWLLEHGFKFFKAVAPMILVYGDLLVLLIWIVWKGLFNQN